MTPDNGSPPRNARHNASADMMGVSDNVSRRGRRGSILNETDQINISTQQHVSEGRCSSSEMLALPLFVTSCR